MRLFCRTYRRRAPTKGRTRSVIRIGRSTDVRSRSRAGAPITRRRCQPRDKGRLIPLVCVDRSYWTQVINFDVLLDAGVISPVDLRLLRFADDAEEAWQELASSIHHAPVIDAPDL